MSTFWGVLGAFIGGAITLIGNVINNYYSMERQKEQWEQERKEKLREWKKLELENLREIFKNAHSEITSFLALAERESSEDKEYPDKKNDKIDEVLKWFSLLVLRYPNDSDLSKTVESFSFSPNTHKAYKLRDKLTELVNFEDGFFLEEPKYTTVNKSSREYDTSLRYQIDDEYRKQLLIDEGIKLLMHYSININFSDLTKSQRKKITEEYFSSGSSVPVPENMDLKVPTYNETDESRYKTIWRAKVNPKEMDTQEILKSWENDYEKKLAHINTLMDS